ncbi:MAG: hypothetical protein GU352_02560 [Acidilobus sp.]|jgi:hypothetical protein|nr:hypothetical protein [Acidilobus sp.]
MRCPEGSYTVPILDLDNEYNVYFHKSIDWGMATGSPRPLPGHGLGSIFFQGEAGGTSTMARTSSSGPG